MAPGLPGVGIGGIFYLISAIALPLRSLWRRARGVPDTLKKRELVLHLLIAAGIIAGIGAAGWLLALALPGGIATAAGGPGAGAWPTRSVLRGATIAAGFITLALVLAGVEISRLAVHRRSARASFPASGSAPI